MKYSEFLKLWPLLRSVMTGESVKTEARLGTFKIQVIQYRAGNAIITRLDITREEKSDE